MLVFGWLEESSALLLRVYYERNGKAKQSTTNSKNFVTFIFRSLFLFFCENGKDEDASTTRVLQDSASFLGSERTIVYEYRTVYVVFGLRFSF